MHSLKHSSNTRCYWLRWIGLASKVLLRHCCWKLVCCCVFVAVLAQGLGLELMTYGLENDDLSVVEQQALLGVSAAIIDDVEKAMSAHT